MYTITLTNAKHLILEGTIWLNLKNNNNCLCSLIWRYYKNKVYRENNGQSLNEMCKCVLKLN